MVNIRTSKDFCKEFEKIENYEEAVNDKNEVWCCHHKMEEVFTKEELIRAGWYYDRKPEELIFIRRSEHNGNANLHIGYKRSNKNSKGKPSNRKGKKCSEETKQKISKANKGKPHSEEWKQKISNSMKGKKRGKYKTKDTK